MSRRAIAAAFVLLVGLSACKEEPAPVQPDRAITPAATLVAAAASGAATTAPTLAAPAVSVKAASAPAVATAADPVAAAPVKAFAPAVVADGDSDGVAPGPNADPAAAPSAAATVAQAGGDDAIAAGGTKHPVAAGAPLGGGAKAKGTAAPKPSAKAPAKPGPKAPKLHTSSELKLVKAGEAPRRKLRLQVKKGQVETMKMVLTMEMGVKELGQKQTLPPMAMTMRLKVAETRTNGDIKYNFTLTETGVDGKGHDPRLVAGMKQAMQKIYGLSGYAVVSDRGLNREAKINLPPKVDQQTKQVMQGMEQAMQQIGAPLPVEEVGVGARWTYTTKLNQGGVRLTQVATYDLVRIKGNKVTLRARVKQSAPKQQVAAPSGMKVSLLKLDSSGKGKTRMLLDRLAPYKSTMKLKSTMTMGGQDGKKMSITTGMLISIKSR